MGLALGLRSMRLLVTCKPCESLLKTKLSIHVSLISTTCSYLTKLDANSPRGYPKLARFIWQGDNYTMFRKFRYLYIRQLLHMQSRLQAIELELYDMDMTDERTNPELLRSQKMADNPSEARGELMEKMERMLSRYGNLRLWRFHPLADSP